MLVFLAVLLGSALCGKVDLRAFLVAASAALVLAGGNALNDAYDAAADAVSHPHRPIPSGRLSAQAALAGGAAMMLAGIALAAVVGKMHVTVAAAAAVALWLYSEWLSATPLLGNALIAALSGLAVIYGALACGFCRRAVWAALLAAAVSLPREIFKDIQDVDGDAAAGRRTLPVVLGRSRALRIAAATAFAAMAVIVAPYLLGVYGEFYGGAAVIPFVLCGMGAVFGWRGYPKTAQKLLKAALAAGIAALWVEALWRG